MKSPEEFKPYSIEEAENEAEKMQKKIKSGKATTYPEAEKEVEKDKEGEEKINNKLKERFGEVKISDDLKKQILPYLDNDTLTIANEYIAAVRTERSERGAGIGFWDQARVFVHDQNAMQEWNWRHKDSQHLDQKHLRFNSIGGVKASKEGEKIVVTVELENDNKSRGVNFEFIADKTKTPLKDGEIPIQIAKPTETYARKKLDEELKYANEIDKVLKIAKASGVELKEDDFRRVIKNILDVGLPEYVKKAQKVAKAGGFELTKDDYKNFVASTTRYQWLDPKGKFHSYHEDGYKLIEPVDVVASAVDLLEKDYEDIVDLIIARNKHIFEKNGSVHYEWLENAEKIAERGKLKKEVFQKIVDAWKTNSFYNDRASHLLRKISEENKTEETQKNETKKQEKSFPAIENVKKRILAEAERMYSFKPEMRSATSRTGNKPYEKPEIIETVIDEVEGYGAFVLKEQIDHDTRHPQMRYALYFVDKSGNEREIFEKHDYVDDGGGGSIYAENDPSITDVKIIDKTIEFKVGKEDHKVTI